VSAYSIPTPDDDRRLLTRAARRFGPDIDEPFPLNLDRDKTLRFWTPGDFRQLDTRGGHALAAAMERRGVRQLGDLVDLVNLLDGAK
jgi:hypothetical protein